MALRAIKIDSTPLRIGLAAVALGTLLFAWFYIRWDIAASVAYSGLDPKQPESRVVADWMLETAPDDPYARWTAARFFERSLESSDYPRSLENYERAVALSPSHFDLWRMLGQARDRNGDSDGAEAAYQRAIELAPAYAPVKWAFGNSLIRHGKTNDGFALVAAAADADPAHYAIPAAAIALQAFDDNAEEARRTLGSTSNINAAIADVFGSRKKFAEALDAWSRVAPEDKIGKSLEIGKRLLTLTSNAHQARIAAAFYSDIAAEGTERATAGKLANGGFESGVKLRNAGLFEWQIAEGTEPQIGLSESVKRSGRYGLLLTFDSFEAAAFRTISQRVAVVPGAAYEFTGSYRMDLKSKAEFKWEVVDAVSGEQLAVTGPLVLNGDWATMRTRFTVPQNSDDIIIRFIRTGCGGGACPATGKMSFDDLSLSQVSQ